MRVAVARKVLLRPPLKYHPKAEQGPSRKKVRRIQRVKILVKTLHLSSLKMERMIARVLFLVCGSFMKPEVQNADRNINNTHLSTLLNVFCVKLAYAGAD